MTPGSFWFKKVVLQFSGPWPLALYCVGDSFVCHEWNHTSQNYHKMLMFYMC